MDPEKFLIRLINKFELIKWTNFEFDKTLLINAIPLGLTLDDYCKNILLIAEEMFHLIIMILGERYIPEIGECTYNEALQREIIHFLSIEPKPFSKIEKVFC